MCLKFWLFVLDMFWYFEVVTGLNSLKVVFQFEVYVFFLLGLDHCVLLVGLV